MTTSTQSRSAFTLMELLIVISIILILMGLVFVGVRQGRLAAQRTKTETTIAQVRTALESYRVNQGGYPEKGALWSAIFMSGTTPKTIDNVDWSAANAQLVTDLNLAGESFPVTSGILDAWKKPLHFRPARFYPFDNANTFYLDKEEPPGRDGYQLWSLGVKNTVEQNPSDPTYDDLTSWPKPP